MKQEMFCRENRVLDEARAALDEQKAAGEETHPAFVKLAKRYDKLLRQSRRLVTMGDRMQQSLNELNRSLTISEERYRGIFENVAEGIYRCDLSGNIVEVNPAMATMFGFVDPANFLKTITNLQQLFCAQEEYDKYLELIKKDEVCRMEVRACGPNGIKIWAEISASPMFEDGSRSEMTGVVGVFADVTEYKKMIEEMCRLARTDSLTGLWNRGYFMELAEREIARSIRLNSDLSFLIIDADYFKRINDTYGHDVGDLALIKMSNVLLESVREVDVVGRFGGEEFVVLLPDTAHDDGFRVGEQIIQNMREAVLEQVPALKMTVSIGLVSTKGKGDDLDRLLKLSDIALYAAKKNGRDRVELYQRSDGSVSKAGDVGDCA